jgi:hypothetical protein
MRALPLRTVILPLAFVLFGGQMLALNLVQNGSFEFSNFSSNSEFSPAYGTTSTGVTGWTATGANAYNIYFFAGTSTTVSAANQWNSTSEMLWSMPNGSQDGGNFIMMDGDSSFTAPITQMILGLTVGKQYTLQFDWAAAQVQSRTGDTTEKVQFSLGSDVFTTAQVSNPTKSFTQAAGNHWFQVSQVFTASSTSELLSFMALGTPVGLPPVVLLDGVSLVQTPEPGTIGMAGIAFAALFAYRKSRRRLP